MAFFCIGCKADLDPRYRACPHCGEPITDFLRQYLERPIDGKYQILDRLGIGGMGEVYKVLHIHLNAVRVIKLMRTNIADDAEANDRFIREARLATKIHHQNVATLHDFSTLPDGSHYMVWEYIEGTNLTEMIRARGRLSPRYAAIIAAQALHGLDAVHRAGIVHRDVSPDNIMIARDDHGEEVVKIIDLGIAKGSETFDQQTRTGMFVGKWKYCSPEHLGLLPEGERIDGRADLYSFGIVMYEMLTGAPPFVSNTPQHYMMQHAKETPKPLRIVNPSIENAPELEALIFKAMEKNREHRFATAREFARELEALIPRLDDTPAPLLSDVATERATLPSYAPTMRTPVPGTQTPTQAATVRSSAAPTTRTPMPAPAPSVRTTPAAPADGTIVVERSKPGSSRMVLFAAIAAGLLLLGVGAAVAFLVLNMRGGGSAAEQTTSASVNPASTASPLPPPVSPAPATATSGTTSETAVEVVDTAETAVTTTVIPPPATETRGAAPPPATTTTTTSAPPPRTRPARTETKPAPPVAQPAPPPPAEEADEPEPEPAQQTQTAASPAPGGGGRRGIMGRFRRGAGRAFTDSPESKQGFIRGIIPDYSALSAGGSVNWAFIQPGVKLASHSIVVNRFRDMSKPTSEGTHTFLEQSMQLELDDVTVRNGKPLTTQNAIFWAEDDPSKKPRGIGVEMIFRDQSGNIVAMLRHLVRENSPEDAAEEVAEAIVEWVEEH